MSDFTLKNFRLVSFQIKISPTTCTFHTVFLQRTMNTYSLGYLRHLDKSLRHCSNNTSCFRFRKYSDLWLCYGVSNYSLYGLDIYRNLLLLIKNNDNDCFCITGVSRDFENVHAKMILVKQILYQKTYRVTLV